MQKLIEFAEKMNALSARMRAKAFERKPQKVSAFGLTYGGFQLRMIAATFDLLILLLVMTPFLTPATDVHAWAENTAWQTIIIAAYTLFFWYRYSSTPGKMLLGLYVVNATNGARMTVKQMVLRIVGYAPSLLLVFMIALRADRRGLHDLIAGTCVVKGKPLVIAIPLR